MEVRRPAEADFAPVLALLQAHDRAVIGDTDWTETELRDDWGAIDLQRDAWVVERDGRLVGYAALFDRGGGRLLGDGYVHPDARGLGVGSTLLAVTEERARERAAEVEFPRPVVLQNATLLSDDGASDGLYTAHGYSAARHFWRMLVEHDAPPAPPPRPPGIRIEPYDDEADARAVHAAIQEAFVDHWRHRTVPWDEWQESWRSRGAVDPTLWWVAREADEVVGAIITSWKRMGDWGFVDTLGVRRPWRGRGVGEALLRTAFAELWRRGEPRVALGVDAQSPTGATRLYERVGMSVFWCAVVWEKELAADE